MVRSTRSRTPPASLRSVHLRDPAAELPGSSGTTVCWAEVTPVPYDARRDGRVTEWIRAARASSRSARQIDARWHLGSLSPRQRWCGQSRLPLGLEFLWRAGSAANETSATPSMIDEYFEAAAGSELFKRRDASRAAPVSSVDSNRRMASRICASTSMFAAPRRGSHVSCDRHAEATARAIASIVCLPIRISRLVHGDRFGWRTP